MLTLSDVLLENNSFFSSSDFSQAEKEYNEATNKHGYLCHLRNVIGKDEKSYYKWKGIPYTPPPVSYKIVPATKTIPDYEAAIIARQDWRDVMEDM